MMNKKRNPQRKNSNKMSLRERLERVCDEFNVELGLSPGIVYDEMDDLQVAEVIKHTSKMLEEGDCFTQVVLDTLKELQINTSELDVLDNFDGEEILQPISPIVSRIKVRDVIKPKKHRKGVNRETAMLEAIDRQYQTTYDWAAGANGLYVQYGGGNNIKQQENMIKVALRTLLSMGYVEMKKIEGVKMYRMTKEAVQFERSVAERVALEDMDD